MKHSFFNGENNLIAKFRIQHFWIWNINAVFFNFAIAFFEGKGLDAGVIPYAMALSVGTGIIGRFIWGYIIDKTQALKRTYMLLLLATLLVIWGSALVHSNFTMFLLMGLLGLVQLPLGSILDSWILQKFKGREGTYNTIRFFGSIGYTIFSIIYGIMVDRFGWVVIYICSLGIIGLMEFFTFFTSDISAEQKKALTATVSKEKLSILPLLKSYRLILISIIGLVTLMACAPFNSFLVRIVEFKGGSVGSIGLAYALGSIGEIPVFMVYNKVMTKIPPLIRMLLSCGLFFLVFFFSYLAPTFKLTLISFIFYGMGYAIYLPTLRFCAIEMAPKGLETSAMTFTEAIFAGLSMILAFVFFGWLIGQYGIQFSLIVTMMILAVVMITLLVWHLADSKQKKAEK